MWQVQAACLIADALRENAVLTMLDLSNNNIGQSGGVAIAAMLVRARATCRQRWALPHAYRRTEVARCEYSEYPPLR